MARSLVQGTINPQPVERVEVQKEVGSARHVQDDIRLDGVRHLPMRMADIPNDANILTVAGAQSSNASNVKSTCA